MIRTEEAGSADRRGIVDAEAARKDGVRMHLLRVAILASSVALMLPGAWEHSATVVEFAQLPAGLAAWQSGSLGIYRVCGPVSKLLYALPAYLAGVRVDYPEEFDSDVRSRREWDLGRIFQHQNVERYFNVYRWSRLLPILVTLLGGWLVCEWSTRLFGAWPGVATLCVWCWSPPILGHGSLVTSDMPAAVAALVAARVFWGFLLKPNSLRALSAGLTLGLAAATKFTLLVLYPCWAVLICLRTLQCFGFQNAESRRLQPALGIASNGAVSLTTSIAILNACYLFQEAGSRLNDWKSDRSSLARATRRLEDTAMAWILQVPLPIPREILRGLDVQIAEGERNRSGYLCGKTRPGGWWYWYLVAFLMKAPLPFLGLSLISLAQLPTMVKKSTPAFWAALCLFMPATQAALIIAVSTGTGTNAAFRYLLPSLTLSLVWIGAAFASSRRIKRFSGFLLAWLFIDAVMATPDHLGWRNEIAQTWELRNGCPALIGDSIDWGQDLDRLARWVARHAAEERVEFQVYGLGSGRPYGLIRSSGRQAAQDSEDRTSYIAVSVNTLFGYGSGPTVDVDGKRSVISKSRLTVLTPLSSYVEVGRTIRVYKLRDVHPVEEATSKRDLAP